jgi:type I restriction enzyme, S subunit
MESIIQSPGDWKWMKLSEIGIPSNESIVPSKYEDEIFEVWSVPNYDKDEPEYLKGKEIGSNKIVVHESDVLLCKINPRINRVWKVRKSQKLKQIASTEWIVVRNKEINSSFLVYQLKSQRVRNELLKDVSGVGGSLMRARPNAVKNLKLSIPSRPEQDKIVSKIEELFSELDKSIEQLKTTQQQLKVYRQTVLKWAFEGKLTNKNVEENELPSHWQLVSIKDLVDDNKHALKAGPFGSSLKKEFYTQTGYKIYGQEQVISGNPFYGEYYISKEKFEELFTNRIKPFDALISLVGTVGKVLILPENCKQGIINPRLIKVSLNHNKYLPKFFKYYFESSTVKSFYSAKAQGTTMDVLNLGIIKTIPFPFCSIQEQRQVIDEIESRLSVADKLEETIINSLQQAEALRQSILKKAFEGKLERSFK